MKRIILPLATVTDGSGTMLTPTVFGKLYAYKYSPGSLDTGTDVTITCEDDGASQPIDTITDAGTSARWQYPRTKMHNTSATALTGTSGYDLCQILLHGRIKVVLAAGGGVTTNGKIIFYIDEQ